MKNGARVIAALLAVLMICMALSQLLTVVVFAADTVRPEDYEVLKVTGYTSNSTVSYINQGAYYNINFRCYSSSSFLTAGTYTSTSLSTGNNAWRRTANSDLTVEITGSGSGPYEIEVTAKRMEYRSGNANNQLVINSGILSNSNNVMASFDFLFDFEMPESYFTRGGSSGSDDTNPYGSSIVIENVIIRDANDKTLDEVDEDTPAFTLDIIYADYGLREADTDILDSMELDCYLVDSGGFNPSRGTKGSLYSVIRGSNDVPRFRASFSGLTYNGGSSSISFQVEYVIDGWYVSGDSTARVWAAKPQEEDDDDEVAPPTPYIIVNRYSYGGEPIEAGAAFSLEMAFSNTSDSIDLENIVMTISPIATSATEGDVPLSIASASNTYYFTALPAAGSISQAIELNVKSNSGVGSAGIGIEFTYEYVVDKKRESNKTTVDIAIPITQIDRFAVDPITDYGSWVTVGDEGWVNVSFINRGKSDTYNISGTFFFADGTQGPIEHFGNLKAGESGYLEFYPVFTEPGEQTSSIVIQYEDENAEQKEITESFTITVDEPWYGGWEEPEDPGELEEPEEPGMPIWKIVLLVIGGLAIAAPIALYVTKRVHAKGSEDFDEDF